MVVVVLGGGGGWWRGRTYLLRIYWSNVKVLQFFIYSYKYFPFCSGLIFFLEDYAIGFIYAKITQLVNKAKKNKQKTKQSYRD